MSKAFYLTSIVAVPAAFTASVLLSNLEFLGLDPAPFRNWSMIAAFYAFGIYILFWYRAWSAISDKKRKFNPAHMALPLLVPIYGLYWLFKAVRGWPTAYNYYAHERALNVPALDVPLFTAYCVVTVVMTFVNPGNFYKIDFYGGSFFLSVIAQVTKSAQLFLDIVIIWTVCDAVNRLPAGENKSRQT
jgi:hypothetical protein